MIMSEFSVREGKNEGISCAAEDWESGHINMRTTRQSQIMSYLESLLNTALSASQTVKAFWLFSVSSAQVVV